MCYIYTITSLKKYDIGNGIERLIYVGSTNDYESRFRDHKSDCFNEKCRAYNMKVYHFIRQYGWDNFVFEVIEVLDDTTTDKELLIREQFYIDKFDSKRSMNTRDATSGLEPREFNRVYRRKYYKNNREKCINSITEWIKNNRERVRENKRKSDAKRHMWKCAVKELSNISCFE